MVEILNITSAKGVKYNHTQNSYKKMMRLNQDSCKMWYQINMCKRIEKCSETFDAMKVNKTR